MLFPLRSCANEHGLPGHLQAGATYRCAHRIIDTVHCWKEDLFHYDTSVEILSARA